MWFYILHTLYTGLYTFAGKLSLNQYALRSSAHFLVLIFAPNRLAPYIVTANVPALYLALHHDHDLF